MSRLKINTYIFAFRAGIKINYKKEKETRLSHLNLEEER